MNKERNKKAGVSTLPVIFCLMLLLFLYADRAMEGVRRGLTLCTQTLFPSLFPFLILSGLLVKERAGDLLGRLLNRPVRALLGLSEKGAVALLLGMLCGFPVGMTTATAYCDSGDMSEQELHRFLLFGNNPSPGFLIGAVGTALFGNGSLGVVLFLSVWLSALIMGILFHILWGKLPQMKQNYEYGNEKNSFTAHLTTSVEKGFSSLLQIFSFVIFFSCMGACLEPILQELALPNIAKIVINGVLEMTLGTGLAAAGLAPSNALVLTAFFAGFGGLSVMLQLFAVVRQYRPHALPYLLTKGLQGMLAAGLVKLYLVCAAPSLHITDCVSAFAQGLLPHPLSSSVLIGASLFFLVLLLCGRKKGASRARP